MPGRGAGRHGGAKQVQSPRGRKEQAGSSATRRGGTGVLKVGGTFHPGPHSCTSAGTISALTSPELRWRLRWRPKAPAAEDRKGPHGQSEISLPDSSPGTWLLGTLVTPRQAACAQLPLKAHAYGLPGSQRAQQGRTPSLRAPDSWVALNREPKYPGVAPALPATGQ